jgi:hypothetical protein
MESKGEKKFKGLMRSLLNTSYIDNYRPDFLKNARTGNNFEIDLYLPDFKMGFEFQGSIHFDLDKSRERDLEKQAMIEDQWRNKNTIIEIFDADLDKYFKANIYDRIEVMQAYYWKVRQFYKCKNLEMVLDSIRESNGKDFYKFTNGHMFKIDPGDPDQKQILVEYNKYFTKFITSSIGIWLNIGTRHHKRIEQLNDNLEAYREFIDKDLFEPIPNPFLDEIKK